MRITIYLFIITFTLSCSPLINKTTYSPQEKERRTRQGRIKDKMPLGEPGKCYAKCLISELYKTEEKLLPIYTGSKPDTLLTEEITIKTAVSKKEWVRNNNKDGLKKWDLKEHPEVFQKYSIVKDTSLTKEFKFESITITNLDLEGGFTDWREVVCNSQITKPLIQKIKNALLSKGYETGTLIEPNIISKETKNSLVQYQKDNNLPIGNLDYYTLSILGINI